MFPLVDQLSLSPLFIFHEPYHPSLILNENFSKKLLSLLLAMLEQPVEESFSRVLLDRHEELRVLHEATIETIHANLQTHQSGFSRSQVASLLVRLIVDEAHGAEEIAPIFQFAIPKDLGAGVSVILSTVYELFLRAIVNLFLGERCNGVYHF